MGYKNMRPIMLYHPLLHTPYLPIVYAGWATATGDIDYSVKLVFSDDEDSAPTTTTASSGQQSKQSNNAAATSGRSIVIPN